MVLTYLYVDAFTNPEPAHIRICTIEPRRQQIADEIVSYFNAFDANNRRSTWTFLAYTARVNFTSRYGMP